MSIVEAQGVSEYYGVDKFGDPVQLTIQAKEKLFLDCLDSFYNDGDEEAPAKLSDDEYEQLKLDLEFEGSQLTLMNKDEIKFMVAANRFTQQRPAIMSDEDFDDLRAKLKKAGSTAVVHEVPVCKLDTGICKSDIYVDEGKQSGLYLPFGLATAFVVLELFYWIFGFDPLLSVILGSPIIFLGTKLGTEKILFQNPEIVQAPCPSCTSLQTMYLGDILGVKGANTFVCTNPTCKATLVVDQEARIVQTKPK